MSFRIITNGLIVFVMLFSSIAQQFVPIAKSLKSPAAGNLMASALAGTTTLVSVDSNGIQGNNYSGQPSMSADGRFFAFASSSDNLVSGYPNFRGAYMSTTV